MLAIKDVMRHFYHSQPSIHLKRADRATDDAAVQPLGHPATRVSCTETRQPLPFSDALFTARRSLARMLVWNTSTVAPSHGTLFSSACEVGLQANLTVTIVASLGWLLTELRTKTHDLRIVLYYGGPALRSF